MRGDQASGSVLYVFAQLLMLPMNAFLSGMDALIRTLQQIQEVSKQGLDVVGSRQQPAGGSGPGIAPHPLVEQVQTTDINTVNRSDANNKIEITHKEETLLTTDGNSGTELDKDLHDDMLKLVRYKVLFVRREYEIAFPEKEDLVSDNIEGSAFTAWKVAEFIQELQRGDTEVPAKWKDKGYPQNPEPPEPPFEKGGKLLGLPPVDKKYLRVYYEVLERYPREKFKYEEQQIRVLEQIRDKLP